MDNRNQEIEKGLQEDVALEPSLEENASTPKQSIPNQLNTLAQGTNRMDSTAARIQDTINQHQQGLHSTPNFVKEPTDSQAEEENIVEKTVNKAAATGISKATGGVVSKEMAESAVQILKNMVPKSISQRIFEFLGFQTIAKSRILSNAVLSFSISAFVLLLLFFITTAGTGRNRQGQKQIVNYLAYGVLDEENGSASLIEYLQEGGWCKDTKDCINSSAYRFLSTFRKKIANQLEEYQKQNEKNRCENELVMNEEYASLLLGTLFYNRSNDELLSSEYMNSFRLRQYEKEMDYIINSLYTVDDSEDANACYFLSKDAYKNALIKQDGYLDTFRSDLGIHLSNELKLQIYEDILSEISNIMQQPIVESYGTYIECSGISVTDSQGNIIGTYALEEYVAGVVTGEMYEYFPVESKKALAVAARTYALTRTNSCQKPIESSSRVQKFDPNIRDDAREVANATQGQILVDAAGSIFSAEYDSWNCVGENTCTYTKKPNNEIHEVTISDKYLGRAAGGHGRGMSQIAAADMADQGIGYEEILKFFYSEGVQISNLTSVGSIISGSKYSSTAPLHSSVSELQGNPFYPNVGKLTGQCVWYARNRAQEILYYSNMPTDLKNRAISSIKSTTGNGEAWYRAPDGSLFMKSPDVTQPRAGAIVSWSGGVSGCTPRCGHVAIVESVNADGTITLSEGWKTKENNGWESSSWSTVHYRTFTVNLEYIKYHENSNGDPYYFNGYVYLLG